MNFLRILGTMVAPKGTATEVYGLGLAMHLMLSAGFGLAHAGILQAIDVTSVGQGTGWGAALGAAHGVIVLAVLPMLLTLMHPLVRNGDLESPRVAMTGFGKMTPLGSLMAHVVFGVATGAAYTALVL